MEYREFGRTGISISRLGFGAMRLPVKQVNNKEQVDMDKAVAVIHEAFRLGVNYIDTAYGYHGGESEVAVGLALQSWNQSKVYLSTKSPQWNIQKPGDYRRILETQLKRLKASSVDFYHLHGIGVASLKETDKRGEWLKAAKQSLKDGLIKHLSFSFHSKPDDIKTLADMGIFSSLLCQYNLLDRANEAAMAYAHEKGLGVNVMGPCGGGRLVEFPDKFIREMHLSAKSAPELAFRFVMANPNVNCALSGMNTLQMVRENTAVASDKEPLSNKEIESIDKLMKRLRKLSDLYCTGCDYCQPCPHGVNIPSIFELLNAYKVYGLKNHAKNTYGNYGKIEWLPKVRADACQDCGTCETKCPQKIRIMDQLKEAHKILSA